MMKRSRASQLAQTFFIKSYGCQMNVYDSGRMADVLAPMGYVEADSPEEAGLVILNTCHIREKAAEKVYSELGRMRALATRRADAGGRDMVLAVAGCVAQAEGEEILHRAPGVDLVFGPQTYHRLPDLLDRVAAARGRRPGRGAGIIDTEFPAETKFETLPAASRRSVSAFLTVQEGCDKFCAFCVVPYTRGAETSRPVAEVLAEAAGQVRRGAREIMLLGQNVNAYHGASPAGGTWGLGELIRELAEIEGLERIRYTTSHPRDMADGLIAAHADVPQLMPYLHLPVQSGSDRVLAAMNRGHTAADYLRLVERLRAARPDLALSSDFIVGHPGEREADFEATLALVEAVGYAQAYSFKFSPRPGTPAADMSDAVPEPIRADRLQRLQQLLNAQQRAYNDQFVGTVLPVLLDRPGHLPDQLAGRSPYMQAVHVDCAPRDVADAWGRTLPVRIVAAHANSLSGEPDARAMAAPAGGIDAGAATA